MTTHHSNFNSISTTSTHKITLSRSTKNLKTSTTMRLMIFSLIFLVVFTCVLEPVVSAPLSVRESSLNTNIFKKRVFACKDFNCSILFRKDEVTPELVQELRNNPDTVKDRNPTTPSQAES